MFLTHFPLPNFAPEKNSSHTPSIRDYVEEMDSEEVRGLLMEVYGSEERMGMFKFGDIR